MFIILCCHTAVKNNLPDYRCLAELKVHNTQPESLLHRTWSVIMINMTDSISCTAQFVWLLEHKRNWTSWAENIKNVSSDQISLLWEFTPKFLTQGRGNKVIMLSQKTATPSSAFSVPTFGQHLRGQCKKFDWMNSPRHSF